MLSCLTITQVRSGAPATGVDSATMRPPAHRARRCITEARINIGTGPQVVIQLAVLQNQMLDPGHKLRVGQLFWISSAITVNPFLPSWRAEPIFG
jgi:hypothetical protein